MPKVLKTLILFVVCTLFLACLVTPMVYSLLLTLMTGPIWPFSRVFDRVIMVSAIGSFYILRRGFPVADLYGYFKVKSAQALFKHLLLGLFLSCLSICILLPTTVGHGELVWANQSFGYYGLKLLKIIPAAILISIIEEGFFRVFLFTNLKKFLKVPIAAVIASLLYATVHFIVPYKGYQYPGYSFFAGFNYLGHIFSLFFAPGFIDGFLGLFIVGLALCLVFHRTKSYYLCVGLHAGWVIGVKLSLVATRLAPGFEFPVATTQRYFFVAQPVAWVGVAVVAWVALRFARANLTTSKPMN